MNRNCALALSSALLFLSACRSTTAPPAYLPYVKTQQPQPLGQVDESVFTGVAKEAATVNLSFKAAGQLLRIHVREGQRVAQGDLIAELDPKDYRLQLQATEAQHAQVKAEVSRVEEMYRQKAVSGNDYEKARAGLSMLEAKLQADQNMLAYTRLTAPFAGFVSALSFKEFEVVDAGMAVATLMDVSRLTVDIAIPASLYVKKERFATFSCTADVLPGEAYPLSMESVTPKADANQLYKLRLQLAPSKGCRLAAGMNVQVHIRYAASSQSAWSLPAGAVFADGGESYVWVLNEASSTVSKRRVTLAGVDGEHGVAVESGVSATDKIVVAGVRNLTENQAVRVLAEPSAANVGGLL
ncbi:MAG: efflux RND transporter periplasmic adaptor subunit [Prevotellaceae bacterium]|nr:efflux RND transporter periplasmic adaptor subunit [Prevotellaceae bacterium]